MDGLCRSKILMEGRTRIEGIREKVMGIYDSLRLSKKALDRSFSIQAEWKFLVTLLEVRTKIEYPYY